MRVNQLVEEVPQRALHRVLQVLRLATVRVDDVDLTRQLVRRRKQRRHQQDLLYTEQVDEMQIKNNYTLIAKIKYSSSQKRTSLSYFVLCIHLLRPEFLRTC